MRTLLVLLLTAFPYGAFSALFCVTSAEAGFEMPRLARWWTGAQIVASFVIFLWRPDMGPYQALTAAAMFGAFQWFALFAAEAVWAEAEARAQLVSTNARLILAQAGGSLTIRSAPGDGVRIDAWVPIRSGASAPG